MITYDLIQTGPDKWLVIMISGFWIFKTKKYLESYGERTKSPTIFWFGYDENVWDFARASWAYRQLTGKDYIPHPHANTALTVSPK